MTRHSYNQFIFEGYDFDGTTATFRYSFDSKLHFTETVTFSKPLASYDQTVLEQALQLAWYVAGTSYYKTFPTKQVLFKTLAPNTDQAAFLQRVYTEGLSQFMFENNLPLDAIAIFSGSSMPAAARPYAGKGSALLQSGGKDSLLLAAFLEERDQPYTPLYVSSSTAHPAVLDSLGQPLRKMVRTIDREGLKAAAGQGALDGHVPVTYIIQAYALIDAILHGEQAVLTAIGNEGAEPHGFTGDLPVNHQWSKTWQAEQLFARYVHEHISPDLQVGSPLRGFSELKIAELFVQKCWSKFGQHFSSCNLANYKQGADNSQLTWCGECPKCANSYLLFAPFVEPTELQKLFGGQDLFAKPLLMETFKGLLGIDGVMKPFECVGEVDELRLAYHMAQEKYGAAHQLPFEVPASQFDYQRIHPHQNLEPNLYSL